MAQPQAEGSGKETGAKKFCPKVLGRFLAITEFYLEDLGKFFPRLTEVLRALAQRDWRNAIIHIKLARYGGEVASKAFRWIEAWVEELVTSLAEVQARRAEPSDHGLMGAAADA